MGGIVSIIGFNAISNEIAVLTNDITKYCNNNYNENENKENLYKRSLSCIDHIIADYDNDNIGAKLMKIDKENIHNKIFCISYFDTFSFDEFTTIVNNKNTIVSNENDTNTKWNLMIELTKICVKPCVMLLLCFINHYDGQITFDELSRFCQKLEPKLA